jgi:uncharacterized protein (DUF58 family)
LETKDLIKKIRRLEIKAKGLTKHIFSGEYHSAFKGRGMAFSEVRDYQIGDEVRTIDWNVTARYNSPHVKVFDEEREMTVMLLIDISGSQNFGTKDKSKRELASEIAALLAFAAVSNNDKVGAILFSSEIEKYIAPEKGSKHALRILHDLLEFKPKHSGTSIKNCLEFHRNTQKKRTITFVLSDFNDANNFLDAFKLTRKKHDTLAIQLADHSEMNLPKMGLVQLFNAETSTTTWVNSDDEKVREKFAEIFKAKSEALKKDFQRSGIEHVTCFTDRDIIQPLTALFKNR